MEPTSGSPKRGRPPTAKKSSGTKKPGGARSKPDSRRDVKGAPKGQRRDSAPRGDRRDRPATKTPGDGSRRLGPRIPDDVTVDDLEPAVLYELRTLPEDLGVTVGRHLAAAERLLADEDVDGARAHTDEAKRLARRVAVVREAAGVVSYLAGDYESALADLRTVRRMRGTDEYLAMMADCERGLGHPERALDLLRQVDLGTLDIAERVEIALVTAGARADLGQIDAALLVLRSPQLARLPVGDPRARVEYAYSDLLDRADRPAEARQWLERAARSDVNGVTDAAERVSGAVGTDDVDDAIVFLTDEDS